MRLRVRLILSKVEIRDGGQVVRLATAMAALTRLPIGMRAEEPVAYVTEM